MYSYSVLYSETEPRRTLGLLDSPSCACFSGFPAQLATCAKHRQGHRLQMMGSVVETISKHEPDSGPHLSCFSDYAVAHFAFLVLIALVVDKTVRSLIKGDQEEVGPGPVDPACHYRKLTNRPGNFTVAHFEIWIIHNFYVPKFWSQPACRLFLPNLPYQSVGDHPRTSVAGTSLDNTRGPGTYLYARRSSSAPA